MLSASAPALSVSGSVPPSHSLRRVPVLFVSGPDVFWEAQCSLALCMGPRRSLCRGSVVFLSGPGALCVRARPALSVSGPGAPCDGARSVSGRSALCVGPWCSLCRGVILQRRSACHPVLRARSFDPPAPSQIRRACHPSSPRARSLLPGENPKPYCLGD